MGSDVTLDGKLLFPSKYLAACDLQGRDWPMVIERVKIDELQMQGGRKEKKPLLWFKGAQKSLVMNKTNAESIKALHGKVANSWVGKTIVLYATQTQFGPKTVDCIRVRDFVPSGKTVVPSPVQAGASDPAVLPEEPITPPPDDDMPPLEMPGQEEHVGAEPAPWEQIVIQLAEKCGVDNGKALARLNALGQQLAKKDFKFLSASALKSVRSQIADGSITVG